VHGSESVEITTPKLDVTGEYERQNYESQSHGVTVSITLPQFAAAAAIANTALGTVLDKVAPNQAAAGSSGGGKAGIGVSYSQSNSHNNSGQYVMSNISSPKLTINAPSQHIDGAVINDKVINPSNNQDYADSGNSSFGFGVGTSGVNASIGFGDYSFGLGAGSSGLFGAVGVGNFNIGTSFKPGTDNHNQFSVFGGGYGLNASLGHSIWSPGISYGPFSLSGSFQHGELKAINGTAGLWGFDNQINDWDLQCFEKDTPIATKEGSKFIQDIKIADWVKTWNENTEQFEYKKVLRTFEKVADQTLHIKLSNGQLVKVTTEHPFLSNDIWVAAIDLRAGSKLFGSNGQEVFVQSVQLIAKTTKVYNFEVEDNHTYVAYGVVVHNKCIYDARGMPNFVDKNYVLKEGETLAPRPDSDGKLEFIEAYIWWKYGDGEPLTVDLSEIDLSRISSSDFPSGVGDIRYFNLLQNKYNKLDDGLVYGTITLKYLGNNQVEIVGNDTYNFEIHKIQNVKNLKNVSRESLRNIETMIALGIHGTGKPFKIYFRGKGKIGK
jgi:hypothetical protein